MSVEVFDMRSEGARFEQTFRPRAKQAEEIHALLRDARNHGFFALEDGRLSGFAILAPMEWDSRFFGRRMGRIARLETSTREAGRQLVLCVDQRAIDLGTKHLMARLSGPSYTEMWSLQDNDYSLMDVGTTFILRRTEWMPAQAELASDRHRLRLREERDLEPVLSFGATLFKLSYFHRDPFFSTSEADAFHREWIINLFRDLADAIWVCESDERIVGFMTCEIKTADRIGSIALVGVRPEYLGRGIAAALLRQTVEWSFEQGVAAVTVRTQSFNYAAVNMYVKGGFRVHFSDVTYCKTLT